MNLFYWKINWFDRILWTQPPRHKMKPISKDAIGDLCHFPVQWLVKLCPSHFLRELQRKEIGPAPQMDTKLQLSMAAKILAGIRRAAQDINKLMKLHDIYNFAYLSCRSTKVTCLLESPSSQKSPKIF